MASSGAMLLPFELIHHIVGYLEDDLPALKACSLLSTQWLGCARLRLFHTAHFTTDADLRRWKELIESCPDIGLKYLRDIRYDAGRGLLLLDERDEREHEPLTGFPNLGPLPSVGFLSLSWSLQPQLTQSIEPFIRSLTSVGALTLDHARFNSFLEMGLLLSLFHGLRVLIVSEVEVASTSSHDPLLMHGVTFDTSTLEVIIMDVEQDLTELLTDWLLPPEIPIRLRSLYVAVKSRLWPSIALINAAAATLEDMRLRVLAGDGNHMAPIIQSLPKLRHISFLVVDYFESADPTHFEVFLAPTREFVARLPVTSSVTTFNLKLLHSAATVNYADDVRRYILSTWTIRELFPNIENLQVSIMGYRGIFLDVSEGLALDTTASEVLSI